MSTLSPDRDPAISIELGRSGNPNALRDIGFPIPDEVKGDEAIDRPEETLEQELGRISRMMKEWKPRPNGDEAEISDEEFEEAERRNLTPAMLRWRDQRK